MSVFLKAPCGFRNNIKVPLHFYEKPPIVLKTLQGPSSIHSTGADHPSCTDCTTTQQAKATW